MMNLDTDNNIGSGQHNPELEKRPLLPTVMVDYHGTFSDQLNWNLGELERLVSQLGLISSISISDRNSYQEKLVISGDNTQQLDSVEDFSQLIKAVPGGAVKVVINDQIILDALTRQNTVSIEKYAETLTQELHDQIINLAAMENVAIFAMNLEIYARIMTIFFFLSFGVTFVTVSLYLSSDGPAKVIEAAFLQNYEAIDNEAIIQSLVSAGSYGMAFLVATIIQKNLKGLISQWENYFGTESILADVSDFSNLYKMTSKGLKLLGTKLDKPALLVTVLPNSQS